MNIQDVLNPQEIQQYQKMGYTQQDIMNAFNESVAETNPLQQSYIQTQNARLNDPRSKASNSLFGNQYNENLIQWQLELDSILTRIEHMLRGDKPTYESGSIIWKAPIDKEDKILNDYGVSIIMRILIEYLNRNTILSNYSEDIINTKMYDFGIEISDLFFGKYETMGLTTLEKRKLYPMLVRGLVDIVHSAYLRALHGGERESLREQRSVQQTQAVGMPGININTMPGQPKVRGLLNPMRYIKGKYA